MVLSNRTHTRTLTRRLYRPLCSPQSPRPRHQKPRSAPGSADTASTPEGSCTICTSPTCAVERYDRKEGYDSSSSALATAKSTEVSTLRRASSEELEKEYVELPVCGADV
eukprot:6632776-Pyramimonas_sp.AAC.1